MTSNSIRLSEIDDTNRHSHTHLTRDDICLFLYEKTSHRDYSFSATNNLISNLKKPVNSSSAVLAHKTGAIQQCAAAFRHTLNPVWLKQATLVPIPPSKSPDHDLYDNRMERVCRLISPEQDVRNLVVQSTTMVANHARGLEQRVSVDELVRAYAIDETLSVPVPTIIGVVDDMLTAGTHFRAMQLVLSRRFPSATIVGLFVARRIFPD